MIKNQTSLDIANIIQRLISDGYPLPSLESFIEGDEIVCREIANIVPKGLRLLDFGAGSLRKTAILQLLGYNCTAIDDYGDEWQIGDSETVQRCIRNARELGIEVHTRWGGDSNTFDAITCLNVLEHFHVSPIPLLSKFYNSLRPGGFVIVQMPNSVSIRKRLDVLCGKSNYPPLKDFLAATVEWRGHVREYTLEETIALVQESGFSVIYAHGLPYYVHKVNGSMARSFYRLLCKIAPTLADAIFVVGRKNDA